MSGSDHASMMELFREEVRAHAATLNRGLIDLEKAPGSPQKVEPLMRAAHSIKGAARIVNIDSAVQLAHVMEDAFVAAQEGRIRIRPADIDVLLRGADVLVGLATLAEKDVAAWSASRATEIAELKDRLRAMVQGDRTATPPPPTPATSMPQPPSAPPLRAPRTITIPSESFLHGDDYSMSDLFREEVRVAALVLNDRLTSLRNEAPAPTAVDELAQAARSVGGAARLVGAEPIARVGQALEAAMSVMRERREPLPARSLDLLFEAVTRLAEVIQVGEEDLPGWLEKHGAELKQVCDGLEGLLRPQPAVEAVSPPPPALAPPSVPASAASAPPSAEEPKPSQTEAAEAVVRVTAQSLNRLMGLAGESLVQARWLDPFSTALLKLKKQQDHLAAVLASLDQTLASGPSHDQMEALVREARRQSAQCREVLAERMREFQDHAAQAEDLNTRLYREVIASRMRPFADGTHAFPRLVRDMARKLGKLVRFEIEGETTEVDRDVLEKLEAPLTHLLRNAVDHGIEPAERRQAAGKSETGLVRLRARHRAGTLAITVSDDGGGMDLERLRAKVVERRLATADMARSMTQAELLEFPFLPGFSTADAVTEYSGRGVGLDVVHTMVRTVGGSVRITTQPGQGTSFHLQLPITLSVVRAVLVEIAGEKYAFPHNRIDGLLRVPRSDVQSLEHRQFIRVDGQNVGLVLAAQMLDLPATAPVADEIPVLLLSDSTGHYGLIVEAFRGEQDLVVRPLDPRLGKVPSVSAAAILDDGSPVLIADVEDLIRSMDQFIQGNRLRRYEREDHAAQRRKRILVVDDSITVREVERQLLQNQGFDVAVAVDGQEAWNLVRAEPFDLVISDVDMPRMNGLQLVQAMRNDPALREVPVIMVSYKEREEDRLRGLEVGADYYLTKSSFHDNSFLQAVMDLIGGP
jgi:two-component system sensor histidine kinase and response regulator WspE